MFPVWQIYIKKKPVERVKFVKIKNHYVPKEQVKFITEDFSIKEAREFLEMTGFRCVPILDKRGQFFRGNVYEIDTYKYTGSLDDSVMKIADDKEAFVYETEPFFKIFFTIRKLPFLAVLKGNGEFVGILAHSSVMDVVEDAFGFNAKGYSITIGTYDFENTLKQIVDIISKHSPIQSLLTLYSQDFIRLIHFNLPMSTPQINVDTIIEELVANKFTIVQVEKINMRNK